MIRFERPCNEVIRAFSYRLDSALDGAISCNHDDGSIVFPLVQFSQHIHPRQIGHHVVKNNQIGPESVELLKRPRTGIRGFDAVAGAGQDLF